jgi:hypothetical protein
VEFVKLKYPEAPIPRRVLLWEKSIPGYSCAIYNCPDTPHLIARINGVDYAVKISSIFKDIIRLAKPKPLQKGLNEDHVSNGPQERGKDSQESNRVSSFDSG